MTPYKAGQASWSLGWPYNTNPFVPGSKEAAQWMEGWSDSAYQAYAHVDGGPGKHGWTKAGNTTDSELARVAAQGVGNGSPH